MTETNADRGKKTEWEAWATRTTAILAVLAALSSGRWGASNLQAILEQGKVNDTWAYYQAKSIKQHMAEENRDLVKALESSQPGDHAALETLRTKLEADAKREGAEKAEQQKAAEQFQTHRDQLVRSSMWYEISFACLQLGVILCTIAAGAKRKVPWAAGIVIGLLGLVLFMNGLYHFISTPRWMYEGATKQMDYSPK